VSLSKVLLIYARMSSKCQVPGVFFPRQAAWGARVFAAWALWVPEPEMPNANIQGIKMRRNNVQYKIYHCSITFQTAKCHHGINGQIYILAAPSVNQQTCASQDTAKHPAAPSILSTFHGLPYLPI